MLLFSPIIGMTALLVRLKLGSPVIFKQPRIGLHEKTFEVYKFRTMTNQKDGRGNLLSDEQRLTEFGRWMRACSLDELPQLWNVFRGDMSFVGPRPLLAEYLPLYNTEQRLRHSVRPGITGLAQVYGRNSISWDEKFKLDIQYVKENNFFMDIKILGLTAQRVLCRKGVNQSVEIPMAKFTGSNQ